MTSREFRDRLARRAQSAGVTLTRPVVEQLETYFQLLARWNARINLTSLPLGKPTDETLDRLLIEPLAAAKHVEDSAIHWFDLGSGGGSPALPLKILRPRARLTMVESKARKAAFLREAVRVLRLSEASVENRRFEQLALERATVERASLVTVRAVRPDAELFSVAIQLLRLGGRLLLFRSEGRDQPKPPGLRLVENAVLTERPRTYATIYEMVFHVEQSG